MRPAARLALALAACLAAAPALACGPRTDCDLTTADGTARSYRIALPDPRADGAPPGAVIFFHGHGGSAEGAMRNEALGAVAGDLGLALVAAEAEGQEWSAPNAPGAGTEQRPGDELGYLEALKADLAARFGIDPARTLVAGFSSGAMLVWTLACERGADFAGFVPMSGTFWAPVPQSCPEIPANLMHFQGTEDTTVPMEGRPIEEAHQGNLDQAFTLAESLSDFGPPETTQEGDLTCTRRTDSAGRILDLCLFPGGHSFRPDFIARAAADFLPPP